MVVTIDRYSRLIVSWRLSDTRDGSCCQAVREKSLTVGCPEIFTTGQGVPFTAKAWTNRLESAGIAVRVVAVEA